MNKKWKARIRRTFALICAAAVCSTAPGTTVFAEDSVEDLEEQTSSLQNELDSLNDELTGLSSEISELASRIEETDASVQKAELDLAAARLNEEMQYDAMKKRIKYMYEAGNTSLLEIIFSSKSMGEFLNNTEFVQNVTEYDRNKLEELEQIHNDVKEKEQALLDEQASLQEMQQELSQRQESLNSAIASTSSELDASSEALQAARDAQAAAQAALEAEQEQAASQGNSGSSSGGQTSGGSGTSTVPPASAETTDLVLFAALLQCEAGSTNYDALLAVATVVMNRVASPSYPNTLYGVIYQSGQFAPTWNGSLSRVLAQGPASLCYQVAQDALNGARLSAVSSCYSFRAASTGHAGVVVGGNVFF